MPTTDSLERKLEQLAREFIAQCESENSGEIWFTPERLAALLSRVRDEALIDGRIEGAKDFDEHGEVNEGTCGVHMPAFCALCIYLCDQKRKRALASTATAEESK